jgi:chemotaxis protein MotB
MNFRTFGRRFLPALVGVVAAGTLLGGCVSQDAYDGLADTNRGLQNRNAELVREVEGQEATIRQLQAQQSRTEQALAELRRDNQALRGAVSDRESALRDFNERLAGVTFGELDAETSRALARLAADNPELISYDPDRGMLRFASDLTFASGSADLRDTAKSGLAALARVLQSATGAQYEIHVVGHTDAQPMSNPNTLRRHGSNIGLSANRAISVRNELVSLGVQPQKIMVAGWGEFRPAVPSGPGGVTPANRRVEIYLTRASSMMDPTPATGTGAGSTRTGTGVDRQAPPTRQDPAGK